MKAAKARVGRPSLTPTQIDAAAQTSPKRTRKVSVTALALYLASRGTTR